MAVLTLTDYFPATVAAGKKDAEPRVHTSFGCEMYYLQGAMDDVLNQMLDDSQRAYFDPVKLRAALKRMRDIADEALSTTPYDDSNDD